MKKRLFAISFFYEKILRFNIKVPIFVFIKLYSIYFN